MKSQILLSKKIVISVALSLFSLLSATSAFSLTAVINFEGRIKEVIAPKAPGIKKIKRTAKKEKYYGQIVIRNFENHATYDRENRVWSFTTETFDFSSSPDVGYSFGTVSLGNFEGTRGWLRNPEFDHALPVCGNRDFGRGNCDPLNPATIRLPVSPANFDELEGFGDITIMDGLPEESYWEINREGLEWADRWLGEALPGYVMNKLRVFLSEFDYLGQEGEYIYFAPKSRLASLELIDAPEEEPPEGENQ